MFVTSVRVFIIFPHGSKPFFYPCPFYSSSRRFCPRWDWFLTLDPGDRIISINNILTGKSWQSSRWGHEVDVNEQIECGWMNRFVCGWIVCTREMCCSSGVVPGCMRTSPWRVNTKFLSWVVVSGGQLPPFAKGRFMTLHYSSFLF